MPAVMNANEINPIMEEDTLVMPDSEFDGEFTDDWDFSDPQVMTDLFDSLFDVNTLKNAEEFLGIDIESLDKFIEEHDTPVDVVNCIEEMIQKLELKEIMEDVESELEMVPVEPVPVERRLSLEFNPLPDTHIDECIDDIGDPFAEEEEHLPVPVERGDSMSGLTNQRPDSPVFDLEDKEPAGNGTDGAGDCWGCQQGIQNQKGHSCCGYDSAEESEVSEAETVIVSDSDSDSDTDVEDTEDMLEDLRQQLREATVQIRKLQEANDYKEGQLRRLKREREPESPVASPVTTTTATPPPATPPPKRRRIQPAADSLRRCAFCDYVKQGANPHELRPLKNHLCGALKKHPCRYTPQEIVNMNCLHDTHWTVRGDDAKVYLKRIGFKNPCDFYNEHMKHHCLDCGFRTDHLTKFKKHKCDTIKI